MVRYPPWYLVLHRHICAIPHFATYRAIIVRYPTSKQKKQARKSFAILSLQVSHDMKSIATGPLRLWHNFPSLFVRRFAPRLPCEIAKAYFAAISRVFLQILVDFQSVSIDFFVIFNQFQTVSINFYQFDSVKTQEFIDNLGVLKRCVPETLAFAFGLRLRSKTRCFKTRVLGRRLPNGKPQERLGFRALRCKTLAFKKRIAIISCDLNTSLGARACV